jgi:hypothetical protein
MKAPGNFQALPGSENLSRKCRPFLYFIGKNNHLLKERDFAPAASEYRSFSRCNRVTLQGLGIYWAIENSGKLDMKPGRMRA